MRSAWLRPAALVLIAAVMIDVGCGGNSSAPGSPVIPGPSPSPQAATTTLPLAANTPLPIPAIGGFSGTFQEATNNAPAGTTVTLTSYLSPPPGAPASQPFFARVSRKAMRNAHLDSATIGSIFWVSYAYSAGVTFNGFPGTTWQLPTSLGTAGPLELQTFDGSTGALLDAELESDGAGTSASFPGSSATFVAVGGRTYWWELVVGLPSPAPSPSPSPAPSPSPSPTSSPCTKKGNECAPSLPPCCPGLVCVPASTRAYCEVGARRATPSILRGADSPYGGRLQTDHFPNPGTVAVIDTVKEAVIKTITVGVGAVSMAITPDGKKAYVANAFSNSISVIDTRTNRVVRTISAGIGNRPTDVAVASNGRTAYVANALDNTVSVIDAATDAVTTTMPAGAVRTDIATLTRCSTAYASDGDTVSVLGPSVQVVATIPVGHYPFGAVGSPDGSTAYVLTSQDNAVSAIAATSDRTVSLFFGGANPHYASIAP